MKVIFSFLMASTLALSTRAETPRGFEPGQTLPDISLINLEGEEVRFSDFLGKQYVLYGWGSWGTCRYSLPGWQKHYEDLKSEGFTIVGIAMDAEGVAPARKYYEKHGVTFPSLVDPNFAPGFGYVPWTFFLDEHSVVRAKGEDWKKMIKPESRTLDQHIAKLRKRIEIDPTAPTIIETVRGVGYRIRS